MTSQPQATMLLVTAWTMRLCSMYVIVCRLSYCDYEWF